MKRTEKQKAFTLVELLIVIVILGILFIVLVSKVNFSTDAAKESGTKTILRSYQLASNTVGLQYSGFTSEMEDLAKYLNKRLDSKLRVSVEHNELVTAATDPWGTVIRIGYSMPDESKGELTFTSAGADMEYDTGDDIILVVRYDTSGSKDNIVVEYPKNDPHHTHIFDQKVTTSTYLKTEACCIIPNLYFYSCECGQKGRTTFADGEKDPDNHLMTKVSYIPINDSTHNIVTRCLDCGATVSEIVEQHTPGLDDKCLDCGGGTHKHNYVIKDVSATYLAVPATCTTKAYYYYSCSCGLKGDTTFTSGDINASNHSGGTKTKYERLNASQHTKRTLCNGCNESIVADIQEGHIMGGDTCPACGEPLHTHDYTNEVASSQYLVSAATCVSPATYVKSCNCGARGTETFTSGGVNESNHVGTSTETCTYLNTTSHSRIITCDSCHNTISSVTEAHTYDANDICIHCGYDDSDVHTHKYDQQVSTNTYLAKEATCIAYAQYFYSCTCGEKGTTKYEDGSLANHDYKLISTTNATCTAAGNKKYVCSVCNDVKNEEIPKIEHVYDQEKAIAKFLRSSATCKAKATYFYSCVCGAKGTTWFESGSFGEHDYTSEVIDEATCQKTGTRRYTCSGCGDDYDETIDKIPHEPDIEHADCTQSRTCKWCGTVLEAATGHNYTSEITTNSTCQTKGVKTYSCTNDGCSYSYTEEIPTVSCIYNQEVANNEHLVSSATCTSPAVYKHSCVWCGKSTNSKTIFESGEALDHNPVNGGTKEVHAKCSRCGITLSSKHVFTSKITKTATCTETGVITKTCSCDYEETETVPKTSHNETYGGTKEVHTKCSVCGTTLSSTHAMTSNDATCLQDITKTCVCGYSSVSTGVKGPHNYVYKGEELLHSKCTVCGSEITTHTMKKVSTESISCTIQKVTEKCECGWTIEKNETITGGSHTLQNVGTSSVCQKCTKCDYETSHGDNTKTVTISGDCKTPSKTQITCETCGYVISETTGTFGDHKWEKVAVPSAFECSNCSVCGISYSEWSSNGVHDFEVTYVNDHYSCVQWGRNTVSRCKICGYTSTTVGYGVIHNYSTDHGTPDIYCQVCTRIYPNDDTNGNAGKQCPATTQHQYVETSKTAATCMRNGKIIKTCSVCDYEKEETIDKNNNHNLVFGGTKDLHRYCTNTDINGNQCTYIEGYSYHKLVFSYSTSDTCTTYAADYYVCKTCNYKEERNPVDNVHHNWRNTYNSAYEYTDDRTCVNCNERHTSHSDYSSAMIDLGNGYHQKVLIYNCECNAMFWTTSERCSMLTNGAWNQCQICNHTQSNGTDDYVCSYCPETSYSDTGAYEHNIVHAYYAQGYGTLYVRQTGSHNMVFNNNDPSFNTNICEQCNHIAGSVYNYSETIYCSQCGNADIP